MFKTICDHHVRIWKFPIKDTKNSEGFVERPVDGFRTEDTRMKVVANIEDEQLVR